MEPMDLNTIIDLFANSTKQCELDQETNLFIEIPDRQIGDKGAIQVAKCLHVIPLDKYPYAIDLISNEITCNGAKPLLKEVIFTETKILILDWNPIFENVENPNDILGCLVGSKLLQIGLSNTEASPEVLEYIINILPKTSIFSLHIKGNCLITDEDKVKIRIILLNNYEKYANQYWLPQLHRDFSYYDKNSHDMIITSFLSQTNFSLRIPIYIWRYIFSFWKLNDFNIYMNPSDDLSDSEYEDNDGDDEDEDNNGDEGEVEDNNDLEE